jgi:hypothetical protein
MIFRYLLTLAFLAATIGANVLPAAAQQVGPAYERWLPHSSRSGWK